MSRTTRVIPILSGGLDSTTLLYDLRHTGYEIIHVLSFDYGQRHAKELHYAQATCGRLEVPWSSIDLRSLTSLIGTSALTGEEEVPEGHYAEETMRATVVPNRNAIMLSIATGVAIAQEADLVAFAAHAGDHFIYPDCRPGFVTKLTAAFEIGNEGFMNPGFSIFAPYLPKTKTDIARLAGKLGVPIEATWSCYVGGPIHCGRCGTCCERIEALHDAEVEDPTPYADPDFWVTAREQFERKTAGP
jgi:7-cyano-7-deazaguanine synthase